jgi:CubicO group peptidase (beta-lactamase class C family)
MEFLIVEPAGQPGQNWARATPRFIAFERHSAISVSFKETVPMRHPFRRVVLLAVLAVFLPYGAAIRQARGDDQQRIRRIESTLLPGVVPKGQAGKPFSIIDRMRHHNVPGLSVAVIHDGKIAWARGYGVTQAPDGEPVTPRILFQAGSISKPVAALGALRLVDRKQLTLDDDVNRYLKTWTLPQSELTRNNPVTLRRLLSHTAGLTVHGFPGYPADAPLPTPPQILDGTKPANTSPVRVDLAPGTKYRYSGGGYAVLQQIVVDVTAKPYPRFMKTEVLDPLAMSDSTFEQPLPEVRSRAAATGHVSTAEPVRGKFHIYPEMAAAGLWTTPTDLARFTIAIRDAAAGRANPVLSQDTARLMLTRQAPDMDVGLGLFLGGSGDRRRFSHNGRDHGFDALLIAFENTGHGAVIMINSNNDSTFVREVLRAIALEYAWPDARPGRQKEYLRLEKATLERYAGTYASATAGKIVLRADAEKLVLQTADGDLVEFWPESQTTFFTDAPDDVLRLEISVDSDGPHLKGRLGGKDFTARKAP